MRLAGKVAIVTGGGSGFGEGIATKFVAEGARVLIADRDAAGGARVATALGANARSLRVDVANAADVKTMVDAVHEVFGGLDVLVNNAGVSHLPQPLEGVAEDTSTASWRSTSRPSTSPRKRSCRASSCRRRASS